MTTNKTALSLLLGAALAISLAAAPASAAGNPFASNAVGKGYLVAEADKTNDAKCGDMKSAPAKPDTAKAADSKCGDMKDMKEKMKEKHKKHMKGMMDMEKCGGGKDADDKKAKDKSGDTKTTDKKADEKKKCGAM